MKVKKKMEQKNGKLIHEFPNSGQLKKTTKTAYQGPNNVHGKRKLAWPNNLIYCVAYLMSSSS